MTSNNTTGFGLTVFEGRIPAPDGRRCLWIRPDDAVAATAINRFRTNLDAFRDLPIETFDEETASVLDPLGDGHALYADGSGAAEIIRFDRLEESRP